MKFSFSVLYSGDIPLVNICLSVEARIVWMVVEKAVASHEHHGADAEHKISQGHVNGIKTDARFFAFYVLGSNSPVSDFSMEIYKNIMRVTKMLTEKFIFIFIFIWSVLRRRMIQEV